MIRVTHMRWTIAIAAAAIALTAAALGGRGHGIAQLVIADQRAWSEPWRLWLGPLVHATWGHLARDVGLVVILGALVEPRVAGYARVVIAGLCAPAIAVLASGADGYLGLSGLVYALLAAALVHEAVTRRGGSRAIVVGLGALLAIKVVLEAIAPDASTLSILPRGAWLALGPRVHQAPLAHLAGAAAGVLASSSVSRSAWRRSRRSRSSPAPRPSPA